MRKEIVRIKDIAPPPCPFNHVVRAGNFLFLSSQLSADLKTNKILCGSIKEQAKRALENIRFLLESSGATMNDIVKAVVYLRDTKDFEEMNVVYRTYFKEGTEPNKETPSIWNTKDEQNILLDSEGSGSLFR